MYHFIYKTTCRINGKYYIGKHSTDNLQDGYQGSGDNLKVDITEFGPDSFTTEILQFCECSALAFELEKEYVSFKEMKSKSCYNIKSGGDGNGPGKLSPMHGHTHSQFTIQKMSNSAKQRGIAKSTRDKMYANRPESFKVHNIICPHCGKSGRNGQMHRYHFDKCGKIFTHHTRTCPQCGLSGSGGNMTRYHFDNCKSNPH